MHLRPTPRPRVYVVAHPGREQHRKVGFNPAISAENARGTSFVDVFGRIRASVDAADRETRLTAWVTWEACATATLATRLAGKPRGPTRIARPHKPASLLNQQHQVTDPMLFDGPFVYNMTRQDRYERLRDLMPGDLVLFGARSHAGFLLDTVFVVGDKQSYNHKKMLEKPDSTAMQVSVDPIYRRPDGTELRAASEPVEMESLSWYTGATPEATAEGMFSFTPALAHDGTPRAFSRLVIPESEGITNTLPVQYVHETPHDVWSALAQRTCAAGLGLATALHTWPPPAPRVA